MNINFSSRLLTAMNEGGLGFLSTKEGKKPTETFLPVAIEDFFADNPAKIVSSGSLPAIKPTVSEHLETIDLDELAYLLNIEDINEKQGSRELVS